MNFLAYLYWNPSREVINYNFPLLGRPLYWYGMFFALGFTLAYPVFAHLLKNRSTIKNFIDITITKFIDKLLIRIALAAILGARIFDVVFYQNIESFKAYPLSILYAWEGGLSSHGGTLGILLVLLLFFRNKPIQAKWITLDALAIPAAIAACFIRIGNFFNQEILGTASSLPWAVIFGNPLDNSEIIPRHPVQLYESFFYLGLGLFLFIRIKNRSLVIGTGKVLGIFLSSLFSFRFFIEFFKEEQSVYTSGFALTMGQLLSIPLILLGIWLIFRKPRLTPVADKTIRNTR